MVPPITQFLNRPNVKETAKNTVGFVTFCLGIFQIYDGYQILKESLTSTKVDPRDPWIPLTTKLPSAFGKFSVILSGATSRPGVIILSYLIRSVFSKTQLEYAFGPNTIFALNPWHPRHAASIAAVIFGLPMLTQVFCQTFNSHDLPQPCSSKAWLTDGRLFAIIVFNTVTSRPSLHIGNQLFRDKVAKLALETTPYISIQILEKNQLFPLT